MILKSRFYNKTIMYFSRAKQEKMIEILEREFFQILLHKVENEEERILLGETCVSLSKKIHRLLVCYYFDKDLMEYLTNLDIGITSYKQHAEDGNKKEIFDPVFLKTGVT